MKILFGQNLKRNLPYRIKEYLLWPAFEFVVPIKGYYDYGKNILEDTVLKLININLIEEKEIADATGLDPDLVSFIKSRLFQKNLMDAADKITENGKKLLENNQSEKENESVNSTNVNIYVDAVTGDIIPYIKHVDDYNSSQNVTAPFWEKGEDGKFTGFYKFKMSQSVGKDSDEELKAWQIHGNLKYNRIPEVHLINETLNRMNMYEISMHHIKNELAGEIHNVYVPYFESDIKPVRNEVFFLVELFLLEGKSGPGDWIVSNGFGYFSNFFSNGLKNISEKDAIYIQNLRKTNTFIGKESPKVIIENNRYPELVDKIEDIQKQRIIIKQEVDSPDAEEIYKYAKNRAVVLITQMTEWSFLYTLQNYKHNVDRVFENLEFLFGNEQSQNIISSKILKLLSKLKLNTDKKTEIFVKQNFNRIKSDYDYNKPELGPLFVLAVLALEKEKFFKDFIEKNKDFVLNLQKLNDLRNDTFHTKSDIAKQEEIASLYSLSKKIMEKFLNIKIKNEQENNVIFEIITALDERDAAVKRTEENLGFLLCKSLDYSLINCFVDIEKSINDEGQIINNKIVLDLYVIYEKIFVLMNICFSNDYKNKDWSQKVKGIFSLNEIGVIVTTKKFEAALNRKKTSMQAACAAFLALSNIQLLRDIKNECNWLTFVEDMSLIAKLRGHGEILFEITEKQTQQILSIRKKTYEFIKLLTKKGFLIDYI